MRVRRLTLVGYVGAAAVVILAVGVALLLDALDGDGLRGDREPADSSGLARPTWVAAVSVPPGRGAGEGSAGEGSPGEEFRPVGGIEVDGAAVFVDAAVGSLLAVSRQNVATRVPLERPRVPGPSAEPLAEPRFSDLALSGEGNLLLTDLANGQVWVYGLTGRFIGPFLTSEERRAAALDKPSAIAVDDLGRIVVADVGDQRIKVFDRLGVLQGSLGGEGFAPGEFDYPSDLSVDRLGSMVVADSENRRVQSIDRTGRPVRTFRETDTPDGLVLPRSLGVDDRGLVHVVDTFAERVSVFDSAGVFQYSYGHDLTADRLLSLPEGIVLQQGRVVVGDRGNRRFTVFAR